MRGVNDPVITLRLQIDLYESTASRRREQSIQTVLILTEPKLIANNDSLA